jgi:hypothetical protein
MTLAIRDAGSMIVIEERKSRGLAEQLYSICIRVPFPAATVLYCSQLLVNSNSNTLTRFAITIPYQTLKPDWWIFRAGHVLSEKKKKKNTRSTVQSWPEFNSAQLDSISGTTNCTAV